MADDENEQKSPFTRPGFIAAAAVVAVIVVCAIILIIVNATRGDSEPAPSPSTSAPSASPTASSPAASGDESVCGLEGVKLSGTITVAPQATWAYEGTTAYPTSPTYGPGQTDPTGFRYCFQHSPEGALFAAANALAAPTDPATSSAWAQYFLAPGPNRDSLLAQSASGPSSTTGTRLTVAGYRVLSYDGNTARIDVGGTGSASGTEITFSAVYSLVWVDGDWKASTETANPIDFAGIPNLAGYTTWGQ